MHSDIESFSGGQRLKGIFKQSTPEYPLVTVVTAVYNGQPYVAGCLESVLRQDYPNIEHIVIDGGSTDGTIDVLRQYDDRIALWKSEPDKGIYDAWNKVLPKANGEWICFLGSDDEFLPGAISAYMAFAAQTPSADYISSKGELVYPSGYTRIYGWPSTPKMLSRRMYALHVGSMHKKSLFERYGYFDTSYPIIADFEFLLRARAGSSLAFMPTVTVSVRAGGTSDSIKALYEANRAKLKTAGLSKALVTFDLYVAITKYKLRPLIQFVVGSMQRAGLLTGLRHSS